MTWLAYSGYAAAAFVAYVCCLYAYRIFLSPLSHFPGPKLAAATLFYEGYYDIVKDGRFPWKIREIHQKYGPIVRINPREIHIQDPDFLDELYQQRLDKDAVFSECFNSGLSSFGAWQQDLHRQRRGAINKFFSKASIASRAGLIQDKISKLCDRLEPYRDSGEVVQMDAAFICLTVDVISEFCYGKSTNYLDIPGFDREFKAMMESLFGSAAVNRQVPAMSSFMSKLPPNVVARLMPQFADLFKLRRMVEIEAERFIASYSGKAKAEPADGGDGESYHDTEAAGISRKATIFEQILDSKLSPQEKSLNRLTEEGQVLSAAGSETTGRALYLSTVHLLKQPAVLSRLKRELSTVMPEPDSRPSLTQLEKLPFLTAVIKESIRLSGSASTRLPRISPASRPIRYKEWIIPPGTPVSLTLFDVLMDEKIFPKPEDFDPMRWVHSKTDADGKEVLTANTSLDRYFVAFSRGPRSCVGMWIAWAELYLTLAHVHRKLDMELYETSVEDVASYVDRFTTFAKPGGKGVRVKITGVSRS